MRIINKGGSGTGGGDLPDNGTPVIGGDLATLEMGRYYIQDISLYVNAPDPSLGVTECTLIVFDFDDSNFKRLEVSSVDGLNFLEATVEAGVVQNWAKIHPTNLYELSDTEFGNVGNIGDGQVLSYDATTEKWIPSYSTAAIGITEFAYRINTTNTPTPNSGFISTNNSDPNLVSILYIHDTDDNGSDLSLFLDELKDGDWLNFYDRTDTEIFEAYDISGAVVKNGDVYEVPVVLFDYSVDRLNNNAQIKLFWRKIEAPQVVNLNDDQIFNTSLDPDLVNFSNQKEINEFLANNASVSEDIRISGKDLSTEGYLDLSVDQILDKNTSPKLGLIYGNNAVYDVFETTYSVNTSYLRETEPLVIKAGNFYLRPKDGFSAQVSDTPDFINVRDLSLANNFNIGRVIFCKKGHLFAQRSLPSESAELWSFDDVTNDIDIFVSSWTSEYYNGNYMDLLFGTSSGNTAGDYGHSNDEYFILVCRIAAIKEIAYCKIDDFLLDPSDLSKLTIYDYSVDLSSYPSINGGEGEVFWVLSQDNKILIGNEIYPRLFSYDIDNTNMNSISLSQNLGRTYGINKDFDGEVFVNVNTAPGSNTYNSSLNIVDSSSDYVYFYSKKGFKIKNSTLNEIDEIKDTYEFDGVDYNLSLLTSANQLINETNRQFFGLSITNIVGYNSYDGVCYLTNSSNAIGGITVEGGPDSFRIKAITADFGSDKKPWILDE